MNISFWGCHWQISHSGNVINEYFTLGMSLTVSHSQYGDVINKISFSFWGCYSRNYLGIIIESLLQQMKGWETFQGWWCWWFRHNITINISLWGCYWRNFWLLPPPSRLRTPPPLRNPRQHPSRPPERPAATTTRTLRCPSCCSELLMAACNNPIDRKAVLHASLQPFPCKP